MSDYRKIDAVNQSKLKLLLHHPLRYINAKEESEEKEHFVFGQFVEDMLLNSPEELEERYFVTKTDTPSDSVLRVLKLLSQQSIELHLDAIDQDIVIQACAICEYGKNWKPDTCYKKIIEAGTDYYYELKKAEGKVRLDQESFDIASKIVDQALNDPKIASIIAAAEAKKVLQFEYRNRSCKGEIDLFVVDHENKTARVYDIKTSAQAMFFQSVILKYRYDFQTYFYSLGAIYSDLVPPGYEILTPQFIVLDSKGELPATIWDAPDYKGELEDDFEYNNRVYEGIDSVFDRLDFHESTDQWDYPMEYYKTGSIQWK